MHTTFLTKKPALSLTGLFVAVLSLTLFIKNQQMTPETDSTEVARSTQSSIASPTDQQLVEPEIKMMEMETAHTETNAISVDAAEAPNQTNQTNLYEQVATAPNQKGRYAHWDDYHTTRFEAAEAHYHQLVNNMMNHLEQGIPKQVEGAQGGYFQNNSRYENYPRVKWQEAQSFIDQLSLSPDLSEILQSDQAHEAAMLARDSADEPSGIQTIEETPFDMDMREFERIFNGLPPKDRVYFQLAVMEKMNVNALMSGL